MVATGRNGIPALHFFNPAALRTYDGRRKKHKTENNLVDHAKDPVQLVNKLAGFAQLGVLWFILKVGHVFELGLWVGAKGFCQLRLGEGTPTLQNKTVICIRAFPCSRVLCYWVKFSTSDVLENVQRSPIQRNCIGKMFRVLYSPYNTLHSTHRISTQCKCRNQELVSGNHKSKRQTSKLAHAFDEHFQNICDLRHNLESFVYQKTCPLEVQT